MTELQRVSEIEDAIAKNKMTAAEVFTQMRQLVYRKPPCYAFCEARSFKSKIADQQKQIDKLEAEMEAVILAFYNAFAPLSEHDSVSSAITQIQAEAVREATQVALDDANRHGEPFDSGALLEYADKLEQGK